MKKERIITSFILLFLSCAMHLPGQTHLLIQEKQVLESDWPDDWQAEGWIYDQMGNPVEGAIVTIESAEESNTLSDSSGYFLVGVVDAGGVIMVEKENYLTSSYRVSDLQWFFDDGDRGQVQLWLPFFSQRFFAGPQGGAFKGEVDLEIPEGALDEVVEIRVATLPPGYHKQRDAGLVPLSYGSVHFEPSGLQFKKPVRIRQTAVSEIRHEGFDPGLVRISQDGQHKMLINIHDADIVTDGLNWYYSLTHFSNYKILDNNRLVQTDLPPFDAMDINMDGTVNEMDAERILWLEGGTQSYEYELNFKQTQSLTEIISSGSREEDGSSTSVEAGASFGGVQLGASREVSVTRANELAEQFGYETQISRSLSYKMNMEVNEYFSQCRMVFTLWNFLRFREYVKAIKMSPAEQQRVEAAYNQHHQPGQEWLHLRVAGGSSIVLGRSLYDGMSLAVRRNANGEIEVYVMVSSFILRTLRGFREGNCERYVSPPRHRLRYEEYPIPGGPADGAEVYTLEYKGYYPFEPPQNIHEDMECGNEASVEIRETRSRMGFREIMATTSTTTGRTSSLTASGSISLPYGVGLSGGVSANTSKTQSASSANSFASNDSEQDETVLTYRVINAHEHHESDHHFYRLFHLFEMRNWYPRFPNEVNISNNVRRNMRNNINVNNRTRGRTGDGGLALLRVIDGKEYWYEAGPPSELIREAGYYLKRIAERPCDKAMTSPQGQPVQEEASPVREPVKPTAPDQSMPDEQKTVPERSGMKGKQGASRSGALTGASITFPSAPSPLIVTHSMLSDGLFRALNADPILFGQLMELLGGEFFTGGPTGQILPDIEMKGATSIMPGVKLGLYFASGLEATIETHFFKSEWTGYFPVTVFPFNQNSPVQQEGLLNAVASGIFANLSLKYLITRNRLQPFIEAGISRQFIGDKSSDMTIANTRIPFDIHTLEPHIALLAGTGLRISLLSGIYAEAGIRLAQWPGSKYKLGGSIGAGYRF